MQHVLKDKLNENEESHSKHYMLVKEPACCSVYFSAWLFGNSTTSACN